MAKRKVLVDQMQGLATMLLGLLLSKQLRLSEPAYLQHKRLIAS